MEIGRLEIQPKIGMLRLRTFHSFTFFRMSLACSFLANRAILLTGSTASDAEYIEKL